MLFNFIEGDSLWRLALAGIVGGVGGGVILYIFGPSDVDDVAVTGAAFGAFTSLTVAYLVFVINAWRHQNLIRKNPCESVARVLSMYEDEGNEGYSLHIAYNVTVRFCAYGVPIVLNATVNGKVFGSMRIGSLIPIRYVPSHPVIALLDGEYDVGG